MPSASHGTLRMAPRVEGAEAGRRPARCLGHLRGGRAAANIASDTVHASSWGRRRTSQRSSVAAAKAATSVAAAARAASRLTGAERRGAWRAPCERMHVMPSLRP